MFLINVPGTFDSAHTMENLVSNHRSDSGSHPLARLGTSDNYRFIRVYTLARGKQLLLEILEVASFPQSCKNQRHDIPYCSFFEL